MILLTNHRKPYMASLMTPSLLTLSDLERSKSRSLRFSVVGYLYGIDIFASSNITTIWMSQKGNLLAGGVFRCPSGLSCFKFKFAISKFQETICLWIVTGNIQKRFKES